MLTGEAGIGKSRLVAVLEDGIEARGFGRLIGRASSHLQSSAFHPMVDLLEKLCGFERHDSPAAKLDKLAQRVDDLDLPENEAMPLFAVLLGLPVGDDYPPLELSPQGRRQRTFELFEELFVGLARKRPLVLIFEDLHWVDPSTVELLGRLLELVREQPILLALAARPEFESPFKDDPHLVVLVLDRLSNEDSRRIVEDLTGGANLPDEILRQILDRTDGVPIFVEELTKMILESDLLQRTEGGYELVGPLPPLAIPPTLSDSLMARLDRLAEAKPIAQQGAVVGREFTYEMLRTAFLVHDLTLHRALRQLVEAELVVERGKAPESRYSFRHSLIHEAAYKSLLKSTRCQYHQRIAHALTAHFSETAERRPELVAYHFTEAGLAESAIGYWQQAGQRALERSAHVEAVSHLGKGLELLARLPESSERHERELPLQATFGSAASAVKGFAAPEVERAYARAHALCQRLPGAPELFWVYWGLWAFHVMRAHFDEALELGERLAEMAVAQGDEGLEMEALFTLGSTRFMRGEHLAAEEALERAIALDHEDRDRSNAFVTGQDVGVTSRSYLALVGWYLGRPDHALALSQEAIAEARRISHPFSLISALASDACLHQYRGEAREAAADAEEALALAEKLGFFWTAQARIPLGWSLATASEPPERRVEGLRQIREGLDAMAASGARLSLPYALTVLADIEWHHGLVDDGLETVERGFETVRQTGEAQSLAELHRLWGELLLASPAKSSAEEAEASFSRAIEIARDQSARSLELRATTSLARLWREEERGEAARERLAAVCDGFTEGFETADLRAATKLLEALGDAVP